MKKVIILCIILLCTLLFGCAEEQPDIESITYNVGPKTFTITLSGTNRVDTDTTKTLMKLSEGGFSGPELDFTITGAVPGTTYTLSSFVPALKTGQGMKYYFSFEEGAFGNYGTFGVLNDKSSPGVYIVTVP